MTSKIEKVPISLYRSPTDPIEKAFSYPGDRPEDSFFTDGDQIYFLPSDYEEFYHTCDGILKDRGFAPMDQRIPVLSYGANAAPALLKDKMSKFSVSDDVFRELQVVPHCSAIVPDSMAAWHGRPGQGGSTFAELVKLSSTTGTSMYAHVAFMTTEQLAVISVTEGVTYSLAEVEVLVGEDELPMKVLAYVALDSTLRVENEKPVTVDKIPHSGTNASTKGPREVVKSMLEEAGNPVTNPIEFANEALVLTLTQKKARQEVIGRSLDEYGSRIPYKYPAKEGDLIGRADFVSAKAMRRGPHQGLVTVPEMELASIRPSEDVIDKKVAGLRAKNQSLSEAELAIKATNLIDPARMLSRRAHDEIATRLKTSVDK